jgi:hypothetical protein
MAISSASSGSEAASVEATFQPVTMRENRSVMKAA